MSDVSQRPFGVRAPFVGEGLVLALAGGLAAVVGGCPGPAPSNVGGAGGASSTTTLPTTTATSASTSTGETTSSITTTSSDTVITGTTTDSTTDTTTTSSSSTATCDPTTCDPGGQCSYCDASCQVLFRDKGRDCTQGGGTICNGAGKCVPCQSDDECNLGVPTGCSGYVFHDRYCDASSHQCVARKTNCFDSKLACSATSGCVPCATSLECTNGNTTDPCGSGTCIATHCEPPIGAACNVGGSATSPGTCDRNGTCVNAKFVFVTADAYAGDLFTSFPSKGPDGACLKAVTARGFKGKWMSWTSDATSGPADRFISKTDNVPFKLIDGTLVANDWKALTSGSAPHNAINLDEGFGHPVGLVWTGTNYDGSRLMPSGTSTTCDSWSSTQVFGVVGSLLAVVGVPAAWTNTGVPTSCSTPAHVYCFSQ